MKRYIYSYNVRGGTELRDPLIVTPSFEKNETTEAQKVN